MVLPAARCFILKQKSPGASRSPHWTHRSYGGGSSGPGGGPDRYRGEELETGEKAAGAVMPRVPFGQFRSTSLWPRKIVRPHVEILRGVSLLRSLSQPDAKPDKLLRGSGKPTSLQEWHEGCS